MREIQDISFNLSLGKILTGNDMYYLLSPELKSVDPVHYGDVFELDSTFFMIGYLLSRQSTQFTMLDIGANIGYYSVLTSCLCPKSIIYSFEPHPAVFTALQKNAEIYKNIHPIQCGISNENKESVLYCDNKNIGGHSFLEDGFGKSFNNGHFDEETMYKIPSCLKTISSFNIDFSKIYLVKIDVQGLEKNVLEDIYDKVPSGALFMAEFFDGHEEFFISKNPLLCFKIEKDHNIICVKR